MVDDIRLTESVREALLSLYDPPSLATTSLAAELIERGAPKSAKGLCELLRAGIEQLRPLDPAPMQSHGWRCYHYLRRRYVDCQSHASIAQDLGISLRHASRVHQDALQVLAKLLLASDRNAPVHVGTLSAGTESTPPPRSAGAPSLALDEPWDAELTAFGRQPAEEMVDVAEVSTSVSNTFRRLASRHRGDLRFELPSQLAPVRINRVALRQIQLNLLLYLVSLATDQGGESPIVITVRGAQDDRAVTLTMCREDRAASGVGGLPLASDAELALVAAKRLAQLQGAAVEEVGIPPVATLRLRLPIGVGHTVLLVDDNPDVGELFRRMLANTPYHLVHVRIADRVLSLVQESPPEAIILDIVMPTRDGWEIHAALQSDLQTTDIPVVICSVLPDRELALSLGAADFLAKPVTRATLLRTLARLFEPLPLPRA